MRGMSKLLALLLVSGVFVGCAPSNPNALTADQLAAMHAKSLEKAGLKYYWNCDKLPGLLNPGEYIARTYLLDENFYCLTSGNRMIAINASSGTLRWAQWAHIAKPGVLVFDPVHVDKVAIPRTPPTRREVLQPKESDMRGIKPVDLLVINTRTNALVIDRKTGDVLRDIKFGFGAAASAGLAANGRTAFVADSGGRYHAIFLHEMIKSWHLDLDSGIKVAPRYTADKLVVASEDGEVQVASAFEARTILWTRLIAGGVEAPILATPRHTIVPCMDRRLYAFDTITGQKLWEPFDCKKNLVDAPQLSDVSVFQYARGGEFHAIGLVSGKLRWTLPDARNVLAAMNKTVYLQDKNNKILLVDEIMGELKTSIQMPAEDILTPNTSAPAIYGASPSGKVYCIRNLNAKHLTAEMLKKLNK
ncbi:MAG: PQQ-binding-like beta-propeller repeat protein [Phycisphaerales bacterium]|jgi:hypothetical protein|nr:PQQ-binding-like beta-propeller repeat protein [Phycisphaerales bacterium]